jgi:hypothetical protein
MWRSFCETLSEQGRYGGLFIFAILLFFVTAPAIVLISNSIWQFLQTGNPWSISDMNGSLLIIGLLSASYAFYRFCRRRRHATGEDFQVSHPLAQLERAKARSRLLQRPK